MLRPEEFIARAPWRFANTIPEQPHEYTVRGETPNEDFEWFVCYIREHGLRGRYGARDYTYLVVDGWRYWTMGAPLGATTVINRAEVHHASQASGGSSACTGGGDAEQSG